MVDRVIIGLVGLPSVEKKSKKETDRRILEADWIVKAENRKVKLAPMFFSRACHAMNSTREEKQTKDHKLNRSF